ncbi:hypothetical protein [Halorhodospira sp. 9622]|uniref:hypothetical protein n=1 Tax=Halorhodospira sp. 9622 TaxID=2899136 RepID=UPI001EE83D21|nr:hypothetical protein [Halorhodospira sp. 9622]MCG5537260.1 hypothetical protein [Halorhodospira sp. 9622]
MALAIMLISAPSPTPAETLRFDGTAPTEEKADLPPPAPSPWRLRLDPAWAEAGVLGSSHRGADAILTGRAVASAERPLGARWELRLGARIDAAAQGGGGDDTRFARADADYDETWLRYRTDDWRLTVGTQTVLWGRVDEIPPTDRLSTKDLTRFALDEQTERRRANLAVRWEGFQGPWKLDVALLPAFRPAELPARDSIWHPVDRTRGRILGTSPNDLPPEQVHNARLGEASTSGAGTGVRISREGRGADYAATVQRVRHSQPYYRWRDDDPGSGTLEAAYPRTWVAGGDLAWVRGGWTWRLEGAWLSEVPVTRHPSPGALRYDTVPGFDWVAGTEVFPGGRDLRVTAQLGGEHLLEADGVLDRKAAYYLTGEIEDLYLYNRLRARLRGVVGLDRHDLYLNPELAWIAAEPHEPYLGVHWFDGDEDSLGGFYRDRRMVVFGWRTRL